MKQEKVKYACESTNRSKHKPMRYSIMFGHQRTALRTYEKYTNPNRHLNPP
jgi:hypothetical protein